MILTIPHTLFLAEEEDQVHTGLLAPLLLVTILDQSFDMLLHIFWINIWQSIRILSGSASRSTRRRFPGQFPDKRWKISDHFGSDTLFTTGCVLFLQPCSRLGDRLVPSFPVTLVHLAGCPRFWRILFHLLQHFRSW